MVDSLYKWRCRNRILPGRNLMIFCLSGDFIFWVKSPLTNALLVHPARKQTISRAEFPHGFVVVLDGRQPACVLRLATRKFRSDLWSAFWPDAPLGCFSFCRTLSTQYPHKYRGLQPFAAAVTLTAGRPLGHLPQFLLSVFCVVKTLVDLPNKYTLCMWIFP